MDIKGEANAHPENAQRPTAMNGAAHTDALRITGKIADAPLADATEERVSTKLRSSTYGPIRDVLCEVCQRVLILRGQAPSFYLKQVAQTVVREVLNDGFVIDNQVEVEWTERT